LRCRNARKATCQRDAGAETDWAKFASALAWIGLLVSDTVVSFDDDKGLLDHYNVNTLLGESLVKLGPRNETN
jgi:hypothetical protein